MQQIAAWLWAGNLVVDTVGHLCFKAAARTDAVGGAAHWKAMARTPFLWIGLLSFAIESWLWLAFLSYVPLSQGVLVGSVNIIGVMIGGRLLFKEVVSPARLMGIGLIALGVALAGWGG